MSVKYKFPRLELVVRLRIKRANRPASVIFFGPFPNESPFRWVAISSPHLIIERRSRRNNGGRVAESGLRHSTRNRAWG